MCIMNKKKTLPGLLNCNSWQDISPILKFKGITTFFFWGGGAVCFMTFSEYLRISLTKLRFNILAIFMQLHLNGKGIKSGFL